MTAAFTIFATPDANGRPRFGVFRNGVMMSRQTADGFFGVEFDTRAEAEAFIASRL